MANIEKKGCLYALRDVFDMFFRPEKLTRRQLARDRQQREFQIATIQAIRQQFDRSPEMQKGLDDILNRYQIHDCKFDISWSEELNGPIARITFEDSQLMRQILQDPNLRPNRIEINEGGIHDDGLSGFVDFEANPGVGQIPTLLTYEGYIYAYDFSVLRSGETWQHFGYHPVTPRVPGHKYWDYKPDKN